MASKATTIEDALGIAKDVTSRGRKLREKSPLDMLADQKGLAKDIRELQRLGPKMSDDFYNAARARILKEMQTNAYVNDPRFFNVKGEPTPFNLAPNARMRTYLMPDGSIVRKSADQPAPRGATPLNKTPEELETLLPPPRGTPAPAAPAATTMSADDAALAAAREANEAARAARSSQSADEAAVAAATEANAARMGPPAPPPRPASAPDVTAASPAEQAFRAGQPTREAVQSNTPRNVAVGVGLGALGAGAARQAYEEMPYKSSGADVGQFSAMDYVPTRPAQTDVSDFSRMDFMPSAPTDVSEFSRMDYAEAPGSATPTGRVPDILAPVAGGDSRRAVQTARSVGTRQTPTQIATAAADNPTQSSGFFSGFFKDPYAGKSARDLYYEAQEMGRRGDEYGSNLLTQRAMSMGNPENMKRGGAANGGKDAALHKALEIIQHMLASRR